MKKIIRLTENDLVRLTKKIINETKKRKKSDVIDSQKYWFNDREEWEEERYELNSSDDDVNWSKDDKGKLISFWYEDRNEGWIEK